MKATGIVRRIDELGRVVIPKEIRRTLRIREGDPLEIFTEREGGVVLKKYSPLGEMNEFAADFSAAMGGALGKTALVLDKDVVVSVSGGSRKDYMGKPISPEMERVIEGRVPVVKNSREGESCLPVFEGESETFAQVVVPVISEGQTIGAVVVLSKDKRDRMGESEVKAAEIVASFLGVQMAQ